ncbi:hydroxyacid dehydrogenase [Candidatus Woesearchaeota archaeon]|nr:hydroxyacid dehydrogenase [Candidatus Woesearchaeota archaeon]
MPKKIAAFELEPWEQKYLKERLPQCSWTFFEEKLDNKNVQKIKDADILCVFVGSIINKTTLSQLPKLKFITTMSTGFDHVDLAPCSKRRIPVSNVPTYGENTVAEHAFALLLNISRRIYDAVEQTRRGNFSYEGLRGFDLKGKTLGVIGTGRIGLHVIKMAKGFGMNVIAYDLFPNKQAAKELGFTYTNVNKVFSKSDVITLHTPYTKQTHHLINRKNLKKLKKGVIIINTARGKLIETAALLDGIKQGIIAAAGLDVLEEENALKEEKQLLSKEFQKQYNLKTVLEQHVLVEYPNVFITPHNAFNSAEALQRILDTTVENIKGFLKGKPVNLVKNK